MREMKDSGVAWIGAVPSDYRTASIGSLFTIKKDIIGREPETVLSITQTGIRPKDLSSNEGQNASSYANYQIVNVGDFAMNHMDLLTGWIDISKYEGVTSPDYRVFTLNDKEMSADYFLRVFQYYYTDRVFFGFGQGVATLGRWRLPAINFKKIDVPVPPVLEQQRIVAAIDEKVGKVDSLIANVQAQIEKLKAYKQSVITEVVTKGLDPTVPMKDSGVEWIGAIPAHWGVTRIKNMFELRNERNDEADLTKVNLISLYTDLGVVQHSDLTATTGNRAVTAEGYKIVRKNDIVVNIILCWMGAVGMSQYDGVTSPAYDIYRPLKDTNSEYYHYLFRTNRFNGECYRYGRGIMMMRWRTYSTEFRAINIPCPPAEEQKKIVAHLNEKCNKIDQLIAIKQAKIEKLEQYKRSLIYEYVTGKKEV